MKLPPYIILHFSRFKKSTVILEKNSTIVNFPIFDLDLSPYVQIPEHPSRRKLNSLSVSELKSLALEHNIDISSVVEKSHLIDSLVSWFDTHPPSSNINTHYRLIGNIVHEGMLGGNLEQDANALFKQGRGHYKCHVLHQPSSTWFQVQDLVVKEIMPQMVAVSEAYVQIWERKRQDA